MKQSVSLAINTLLRAMIRIVAADHPVIVIDSFIQGEVNAMVRGMKAVGLKEDMTFFLFLLFLC